MKHPILLFSIFLLSRLATAQPEPTPEASNQDSLLVRIAADTLSGDQQEGGIPVAALEAYNSAVNFLTRQETDSALEAFSRALVVEPDFPKALYNRASVHMAMKDYSAAAADYERYTQIADTARMGWYLMAQALHLEGRYDRALDAYREAIQRDAFAMESHLARAEIMRDYGDADEAIASFSAYLAYEPQNALAYHDRGGLYAQRGDIEAAERDFRQAVRIDPDMAQGWTNLASVLQKRGEYDESLTAYDRALRLEPQDALVLNNRGYVLFLKEEFDKAAADFRRAIDADESYAPAYNNLAGALIKREKYADAIEAADGAIALDPNYGSAFLNRGIAREMVRDIPGACADWQRAADLEVKYADEYQAAVCKYIK